MDEYQGAGAEVTMKLGYPDTPITLTLYRFRHGGLHLTVKSGPNQADAPLTANELREFIQYANTLVSHTDPEDQ